MARNPLDAFYSFYQFLPSYTGLGADDIDQLSFSDAIFAGADVMPTCAHLLEPLSISPYPSTCVAPHSLSALRRESLWPNMAPLPRLVAPTHESKREHATVVVNSILRARAYPVTASTVAEGSGRPSPHELKRL